MADVPRIACAPPLCARCAGRATLPTPQGSPVVSRVSCLVAPPPRLGVVRREARGSMGIMGLGGSGGAGGSFDPWDELCSQRETEGGAEWQSSSYAVSTWRALRVGLLALAIPTTTAVFAGVLETRVAFLRFGLGGTPEERRLLTDAFSATLSSVAIGSIFSNELRLERAEQRVAFGCLLHESRRIQLGQRAKTAAALQRAAQMAAATAAMDAYESFGDSFEGQFRHRLPSTKRVRQHSGEDARDGAATEGAMGWLESEGLDEVEEHEQERPSSREEGWGLFRFWDPM